MKGLLWIYSVPIEGVTVLRNSNRLLRTLQYIYVCRVATDCGLDESRWGRDFPSVQTGPVAHPASCAMGTGYFPGVEAAGAWG